MALPWDRWSPDAPDQAAPVAPSPAEPVQPQAPVPASPPSSAPVRESWDDVLDAAWPQIKDQVLYARDSAREIMKGRTVDVLHPTVTAETQAGKELVVADAKSRSWRTLIQGLFVDVIFAVVAAIAFLTGNDPFVKETWIAFGILLLKSVASAVVSYFMRLKIQPTIKLPEVRMNVMPVPTRIEEEQSA